MALGAVLLIPFLTVELWENIPSYSRYVAAVPGLLVMAYGVTGDSLSRALLAASVGLALFNPVIAVLPTHNGGRVTPPEPVSPQVARADVLARCIEEAGVVARRGGDAPPGATAVRLTAPSGQAGSLLVFASPAEARRASVGLLRFARDAGGEGTYSGSEVVIWPRGVGAAEARSTAACLR